MCQYTNLKLNFYFNKIRVYYRNFYKKARNFFLNTLKTNNNNFNISIFYAAKIKANILCIIFIFTLQILQKIPFNFFFFSYRNSAFSINIKILYERLTGIWMTESISKPDAKQTRHETD